LGCLSDGKLKRMVRKGEREKQIERKTEKEKEREREKNLRTEKTNNYNSPS
jgi:hypothetical protein